MARKKKTEGAPEIDAAIDSEVTPSVAKEIEEYPFEDDKPNYIPPTGNQPAAQPSIMTKPTTPVALTAHEVAMNIRKEIKTTIQNAPKRNDATTMPAIVNLRGKTGDFHFMMPQFDAATVQKLWNKYKNRLEPEEFVNYLYSTMGLNLPKLYMKMDIVNIS